MAKEYIEREAAIEALRKALDYSDNKLDIGEFKNGCIAAMRDDIIAIGRVPAADVVEVVRCKDCKNCLNAKTSAGMRWCRKFRRGVYPDDFCSCGERKEQE